MTHFLGIFTVDGADLCQTRELVVCARRTQRSLDHITRTQASGANHIQRHKSVIAAGHIPVSTNVTKAFIGDVENALDVAETLCTGSGDVNLFDKLGLLLASHIKIELFALFAQLGNLHCRQLLA